MKPSNLQGLKAEEFEYHPMVSNRAIGKRWFLKILELKMDVVRLGFRVILEAVWGMG